ncbi:DUF4138 domain-containing protein [Pontibacter mangrovi]|nr:DUF4138 domain-containing protein [Pontibacter mangrovi]
MRYFFLLLLALSQAPAWAQGALPVLHVHENVSTHILSPEPIQYVDLSTDQVAGDLPAPNLLRLKPKTGDTDTCVVTIAGERFLMQYRLAYGPADSADTQVRLDPLQAGAYLHPAVELSTADMKRFALQLLQRKPRGPRSRARGQGLRATVNQVATVGDYYFVDLSLRNKSAIPFTLDRLRCLVEDRKVLRATNFQQVEVQPLFQLYDTRRFARRYRNVLVFRKFTFPEEKVFRLEVTEAPLSGRRVCLELRYADILRADAL